MNVRDKINELTEEYKRSLTSVSDGEATNDEIDETMNILEALRFYTVRLLTCCNDEIEGT